MNKKTVIMLIVASCLILIGCILFIGVMSMSNWNFSKLSTSKYVTNHHEIKESYTDIEIITDCSDIVFVSSAEGSPSLVTCYETENMKHTVSVTEDTLRVHISDTRKWYEHIGINFENPKITVAIPAGLYGRLSISSTTGRIDLPADFSFGSIDITGSTGDVINKASSKGSIKIKISTGDITLENITARSLDLSVSTGKISTENVDCSESITLKTSTGSTVLKNTLCQSIVSKGTTGDITLKNTVANDYMEIKRSTGDVKLDLSDSKEIFISTDTGTVTGTLLTGKVFTVKSSTGKIDVPTKNVLGGSCVVSTDTGDIRIKIKE